VSPGLALFLVVLFVVVALAGASFFRHTVAVLLVFLALPLAAAIAVIHTIADTLRLLRAANRPTRESSPALARDRAEKSQSERSRIAA
jgi:hypothetical protein